MGVLETAIENYAQFFSSEKDVRQKPIFSERNRIKSTFILEQY